MLFEICSTGGYDKVYYEKAYKIKLENTDTKEMEDVCVRDIDTMKELLLFCHECNYNIIVEYMGCHGLPTLEIYDSWRE